MNEFLISFSNKSLELLIESHWKMFICPLLHRVLWTKVLQSKSISLYSLSSLSLVGGVVPLQFFGEIDFHSLGGWSVLEWSEVSMARLCISQNTNLMFIILNCIVILNAFFLKKNQIAINAEKMWSFHINALRSFFNYRNTLRN